MRAAFINQFGGIDRLSVADLEDPVLAAGEVMVDVHAASINAADYKVRQGISNPDATFPLVLGRDFSGVVSALATDVSDFNIGDPVFGVLDTGIEGAYTDRLAIRAEIVARKPEDVSHVQAAALALTGLTATVALEETLKIKSGEKLLIQGGAGGVGSFAVQLARHLGAQVITTASEINHDYLRRLGADQIIDYSKQDFRECVSDCDAVFDTVGGEVAQRSFDVLKTGGRAAFIASGATAPESPSPSLISLRPQVLRQRGHLQRTMQRLADGVIQPAEVRVFPLEDVRKAHEISEGRHLRGKLVLQTR